MPSYGAMRRGGRPRGEAATGGVSLPQLPRAVRGPRLGALRADLPVRSRLPYAPDAPPEVAHSFPDPPPDWEDSVAEWAIWWAHEPLGRGPVGGAWFYRAPLGGNVWTAGFVPDFLESDLGLAIDVLGAAERAEAAGILTLRAVILRRFGLLYIIIPDDIATLNPIAALRAALGGEGVVI
jgi:hypothetical protein